jgi:hypothetical protein
VMEGDATSEYAAIDPAPVGETERRLRRNTYWLIVIGVVIACAASGWRMALGVALGGALSLLNARWLAASAGAMLKVASGTGEARVPRWAVSRFFLRYCVVAVVLLAAALGGWAGLLGAGLGFAAFVGAAMVEAAYQTYLSFRDGV